MPDLAHLDSLSRKLTRAGPDGLTAREVEVLRLVAAGKTNRGIAADLVRGMVGRHRLPDALRRADALARAGPPAATMTS